MFAKSQKWRGGSRGLSVPGKLRQFFAGGLDLFRSKSNHAASFQPACDRRQIIRFVPAVVKDRMRRAVQADFAVARPDLQLEQAPAIAVLIMKRTKRRVRRL